MGKVKEFWLALLGRCATDPLDPALWRVADGQVRLKIRDAAGLERPGGAVYLKGQGLAKPILVVNWGAEGYSAYTDACTHGGRKLDPAADGQGLRCCSLGHSTFDRAGNRLGGPAKGPLTTHALTIDQGELLITL